MRTAPLSSDDRAVILTDRGRDLLEANRHERQERTWEPRQTFYAGLRKLRELTHDSKVYRAYVQVLEWLFPERKRLAETRRAGPADERYPIASKNFSAPKFRALYSQWLEDPANTLWIAGSNTIADALERGHGRVECVELSRQYLHLSPLVDVA